MTNLRLGHRKLAYMSPQEPLTDDGVKDERATVDKSDFMADAVLILVLVGVLGCALMALLRPRRHLVPELMQSFRHQGSPGLGCRHEIGTGYTAGFDEDDDIFILYLLNVPGFARVVE